MDADACLTQNKASAQDGLSPTFVMHYWGILQQLCNLSRDQEKGPVVWKSSCFFPLPDIANSGVLRDTRSVTDYCLLTWVSRQGTVRTSEPFTYYFGVVIENGILKFLSNQLTVIWVKQAGLWGSRPIIYPVYLMQFSLNLFVKYTKRQRGLPQSPESTTTWQNRLQLVKVTLPTCWLVFKTGVVLRTGPQRHWPLPETDWPPEVPLTCQSFHLHHDQVIGECNSKSKH